ncbi:MAG TPA: hypothetical protein VFS00_01695, partial [Polyangiaceae bacterium]|nr:hypothetical protein [Polyangiaceae bacterium]
SPPAAASPASPPAAAHASSPAAASPASPPAAASHASPPAATSLAPPPADYVPDPMRNHGSTVAAYALFLAAFGALLLLGRRGQHSIGTRLVAIERALAAAPPAAPAFASPAAPSFSPPPAPPLAPPAAPAGALVRAGGRD